MHSPCHKCSWVLLLFSSLAALWCLSLRRGRNCRLQFAPEPSGHICPSRPELEICQEGRLGVYLTWWISEEGRGRTRPQQLGN